MFWGRKGQGRGQGAGQGTGGQGGAERGRTGVGLVPSAVVVGSASLNGSDVMQDGVK